METRGYYSLKNPTSSDLLPKVPDRKVIRFYYMHGEPGSTTSWYNDPNTMNPCPVNTSEPALVLKLDLASFYFHPFKFVHHAYAKSLSLMVEKEDSWRSSKIITESSRCHHKVISKSSKVKYRVIPKSSEVTSKSSQTHLKVIQLIPFIHKGSQVIAKSFRSK